MKTTRRTLVSLKANLTHVAPTFRSVKLDHSPNMGIKVRHAIGRNISRIDKIMKGLEDHEADRMKILTDLAKKDKAGEPIKTVNKAGHQTFKFKVGEKKVLEALEANDEAHKYHEFMNEEIEFDVFQVKEESLTDDCQYIYELIEWIIAPDED